MKIRFSPVAKFTSSMPRLASRLEDEETLKDVRWVSQSKNVKRYVSLVDFLVCEFFVTHRDACFRWYSNEHRPKLMDTISAEQLETYEDIILVALEVARLLRKREIRLPFSKFVGVSKKIHKNRLDIVSAMITI